MASIGELTATVRADVSGFVGPMQQVVTTTQRTASQVQSIIEPTQALGQQLGQTATAGKIFGVNLGSLRGSLASLASGLAGIPGPLGNIASKFAMFGAGGGVTVAVLAGVAAIVAIFRKATEETRKQQETVDDLKQSYDEMFGAVVRLRREQARAAVEAANRGRLQIVGTGMLGIPLVGRLTDTQELTRATQALQAAERAYAEHNRNVLAPGVKAAKEALDAYRRSVEETEQAVKNSKEKGEANTAKKVEDLTKEARAWMELKAQISATVAEEERRRNRTVEKSDVKDDNKQALQGMSESVTQGARDAANSLAAGFMSAFSDRQENIAQRITSVLRSAIQDAMQRLLAQKLFEGLLALVSPDKGLITGGTAGGVGDIVSGIFGAPPAMAAGSGTIIVPLDSLPPPLSPVEVARDAMHQTVWMETARVAEMNGFRLVPRTR